MFPSGVSVTSPTMLSRVSKSGFTASWNATTSPIHIQIEQLLDSMHFTLIERSYKGGAGAGAVSASAMSDLVAGAGLTNVALLTLADTMSRSGDYSIDVSACVFGLGLP